MNELTQFGQHLFKLKQARKAAEKQALLTKEVSARNSTFAQLWWWLLNPMVTYGISDIPKKDPLPSELRQHYTPDWAGLTTLLDHLHIRSLTGHQAQSAVYQFYRVLRTDEARRAFRAIIRRRPDCGVSAKTLNKAFPDLIPQFNVSLAKPWDEKAVRKVIDKSGYVLVEPKYDGERRIAIIDYNHDVQFRTRTGHEDSNFPELMEQIRLKFKPGTVLDGELYPLDNNFNRLSSVTGQQKTFSLTDANLCFVVFDTMLLADWESQSNQERQIGRSRLVRELAGLGGWVCAPPQHEAKTFEEVERLFFHYIEHVEGIIIKDPTAPYAFKRSNAWIKRKIETSVDLIIADILPGEPDTQFSDSLGRFGCYHEGVYVKVAPGRLSHEERQTIYDNPDDYVGAVIEVVYQEETPDGSLRHPRFFRWRPDK